MVKSPCKNICTLDNKSDLCIGCLRTSSEIANWVHLDETEKKKVIFKIKSRRLYLKREMIVNNPQNLKIY